ncbi:carcinoembryonic antigen-related cell adhesion molecule 8-like [Pelobates cultripes]|uniref:Carcinoembryonic antigen-related cell adhesion molecule 8-like n=1 Tax=Pelobates cultripes TaxID=61616 RepID=A0AAD1WQJ5_PELCU|nr:carcinoembryonic antigen-related cell adhesion molecule 8-like [Pelobates cultripes]
MQPISALSIQLIPQYPAVGQSVTLSVTGINGTIRVFSWYKGPNINADNQILSYIPSANPPQANGNQYFSRASGLPNVSLLISDLVITDQGIYTVYVQTDRAGGRNQESVNLTVYIPVTKPVIRANSSLVKENDTATLTCETENAERIAWGRSNGRLPSAITLSNDNRTLTFSSIKRLDSGDYYCEAENVINKIKSDIYTLTVNYGPENLIITGPNGIESLFNLTVGTSLSLRCSAVSFPPPTYHWKHNEIDLRKYDSILTLDLSLKENGSYTCTASNSKTNITVATSVVVIVYDRTLTPETTGLSGDKIGIIIGIVVAIIVVALIAALIYLFVIQKARQKNSNKKNQTTDVSVTPSSGNGHADQYGTENEIQYSSVNFTARPGRQPPSQAEHEIQYSSVNISGRPARKPPAQPNDDSIVYSELRLS